MLPVLPSDRLRWYFTTMDTQKRELASKDESAQRKESDNIGGEIQMQHKSNHGRNS